MDLKQIKKQDMTKVDKPISPKKKYALRLIELSKKDSQIGQLMPADEVREKALEEGLTLDRIIGVFLEGYAARPAMGERSYEVVEYAISKKKIRNYLPAYSTITYGEFHDRIKAISM